MANDDHRPPGARAIPAVSDDGVDLTLIQWLLSLSVDERLELLEDHASLAWELRCANPLLIEVEERAGRPKDIAVLPILRQTLAEALRQRRRPPG
jgi:hypothetical protein